MLPRLNLIEQKFSRLTVIKFSHLNKWKISCWKCKCECGNFIIISSNHLKDGHTKSCGCLKIEKMTKHKMTKTRFYTIWQGMKTRCLKHNYKYYKYYGGRGITVCQHWLKFENFKNDMYNSYLKHCNKYSVNNTQIDRINNNGNYCKKNSRWTTHLKQMNNTRHNHFLTYKKQTLTITQWARKLNINPVILYSRINTYKWSISKAFTTPVRIRKK